MCSARTLELGPSRSAPITSSTTPARLHPGEARYDLILDNVGNHSLTDTPGRWPPGGTLLSNGAPVRWWTGGLDHVTAAMVQSLVVRQQGRPFVAISWRERLTDVRDLVVAGSVRPVIDGVHPLGEGPQAIAHVVDGHARGTAVISMEQAAA